MAEKKGRKYTWYIEPNDTHTHNIIYGEYDIDTDFLKGKICADGVPRDLWRVRPRFVKQMQKSRIDKNLEFNILVQEGDGKIRLFNLWKKSFGKVIPFRKGFKKFLDGRCRVCGGEIKEWVVKMQDPIKFSNAPEITEIKKGYHCVKCKIVYSSLPEKG